MSSQLPLFADLAFQGRTVKSVTFKGNFDYPIHRWFRLTPSFSPELVADILTHWDLPPGAKILEPFSGVGTTPLVCQSRGFQSAAVEINPLLHFVSVMKTTPLRDPNRLLAAGQVVIAEAQRLFSEFQAMAEETFLVAYARFVPKIHQVGKWWSPPVLKKLVALKIATHMNSAEEITDFLQLAAASILIEVSNARHNHPSLSFAKIASDDAPVFERFGQQIELMVRDLHAFLPERPETRILSGNSKYLERLLTPGESFDAVITSPPYPNRYSYARETRPQMFYLDLIRDGGEVGNLEVEAIGGTWGKATSVLAAYFEYRSETVRAILRSIPEQVEPHSPLMRNYIVKYFNDLETHVESLRPFLRPDAKLAYIIGNSKFYDIPLPTDELLADLFEANGFAITSVERMRRRNSKSGLYEAIVFMNFNG